MVRILGKIPSRYVPVVREPFRIQVWKYYIEVTVKIGYTEHY